MNEKLVMKYFELLYPNFDNMEPHEQYIAAGDETFIRENLDEIDKYYQDCKKPGTYAQESEKSDSEIIRMAVMGRKVEKYFEMLHPEFESLNSTEQFAVLDDKVFILDNIDEIDRYYQECQVPGTYAQKSGKSDSEIIRIAVMGRKVEKYFGILHPDFESLNPAEQFEVLDDRIFITDNIETIDAYYRACQVPDSYAQEQGFTDKEIIQLVVEEERARQQEESQQNSNEQKRITPGDIEEATQGTRIENFKQATKDIKEASKEAPEKDGVSIDD